MIQVSDELHNLVKFIIEAINCEVVKRPVSEAAKKSLVRNLEYFPARPIIRKQVLYEQDYRNYMQIEKKT